MGNSKKLCGLGIAPGIGIGTAIVLGRENVAVPRHKIFDRTAEIERFGQALRKIKHETHKIYRESLSSRNISQSDILNAYMMFTEDNQLTSQITTLIQEHGLNAAAAVNDGMDVIITTFDGIEDPYMKERAADIRDIKDRLLRELLGIAIKDITTLDENTVVVCDNLSLSDVVKMDISNVSGIVSKAGGDTSHAFILAKNLDIPIIVGALDATSLITDGDPLLLDGSTGEIILRPDEPQVFQYRTLHSELVSKNSELNAYKNRACVTLDGVQIKLLVNVDSLSQISLLDDLSADGIGLFRSEILYIGKNSLPREDEQFEIYKNLLVCTPSKPVSIRTMDIGGDKTAPYFHYYNENNPFLGYRGIRVSLDKTDIFKSQLRALLRASVHGNLQIIFPMISCINELRSAKSILEEVKSELRSKGVAFNENIKLGIMIETPSAAILADHLAKDCDFFSIGTNDLIQYTLAIDRNNCMVSQLYSNYHPSVLRLVENTVKAAKSQNIGHCICGEIARDCLLLPVLVAMGIRCLSVTPSAILSTRKAICNLSKAKALELKDTVMSLDNDNDIKDALLRFANQNNFCI